MAVADASNPWEWRVDPEEQPPVAPDGRHLLPALVAHLRGNRIQLRDEWARRITDARLLTALRPEEIFSEATSVYDHFIEVLETGQLETLQTYSRDLGERLISRDVATEEVLGALFLLRDVLTRSLVDRYDGDVELLNRVFDAYESSANRIATTVGTAFVHERERAIVQQQGETVRQQQEQALRDQREALHEQHEEAIRQQQQAIRELSAPVLRLRQGLLVLPIVGMLDTERTRHLGDQLLDRVRAHRARAAVIDVTGVPEIDPSVATQLIQTIEASRLMGASVVITGISPAMASSLAASSVDLTKLNAIGDLQGGVEHAEQILSEVSPATPTN